MLFYGMDLLLPRACRIDVLGQISVNGIWAALLLTVDGMRAAADSGAGRGPHWLMDLITKWKFHTKMHYFCMKLKKNIGGSRGTGPLLPFRPALVQNSGCAVVIVCYRGCCDYSWSRSRTGWWSRWTSTSTVSSVRSTAAWKQVDSCFNDLTASSCHSLRPTGCALKLRYKKSTLYGLRAWHSGNALYLINKAALHWARLVFWWVTVCGQVNHFGM